MTQPFVPVYYRMTLRGRQRLTDREGKRLKAYPDSRGIWTIGVGHAATAGTPPIPHAGMTITAEECDAILAADLAPRERKLNEAIKVPVADHEFDALLSIFFNAGPDFLHSHAIQTLNADDRVGCARHIMDWVHPPEVTGRRHTEQSQFLTPYTIGTHPAPSPHPTAPVAPQQAQWPERPLFADIWKHPYFRRDDDPDHA